MSPALRVILRNSLFGVVGEAISGVLLFVVFIIIARWFGSSQFGTFSYILAFVGIFQLIADFGLTNILVREIARSREKVAEIVGAVRPLAWLFSALILVSVSAIAYPLSSSSEVYAATLLMAVAVLATFHSVIYGSVCRAHEEMGFNALGNAGHKVLLLGAVVLALTRDGGLLGVSIAFVAANVAQGVFFYLVARRRYLRHLQWKVDPGYWRYLVSEAAPVGIAMIFRRLTLHADTLLLAALSTSTAVGLFNVAYKLVQVVDMVPFTLALPLFPPLSRLARESKDKLHAVLSRVLSIFMIAGAPIAVWIFISAPLIVSLLFGDNYRDAVPVLRILAPAIVFLFPGALYIYLFSAIGKQGLQTLTAALCLGVNIALDLLLIPRYGHSGAAAATLIAEGVFFASGLWLLVRTGYRPPWLRTFVAPIFIAVVTGAPLAWSAGFGSWTLFILASILFAITYFLLIILTGTLGAEDRALLYGMWNRRVARHGKLAPAPGETSP